MMLRGGFHVPLTVLTNQVLQNLADATKVKHQVHGGDAVSKVSNHAGFLRCPQRENNEHGGLAGGLRQPPSVLHTSL